MLGDRVHDVVVANGDTNSASFASQGLMAIYVPTITNGTVKLQGSWDGTNFADLKDTTPATVGSWAASTGDFWLDGDTLARFLGLPILRIVCGAAQGAARTFKVVRGILK